MTVLVTGATGFIGNALVQKLLLQKTKLRVFIRDENRIAPDVQKIIGDITDLKSCKKACDGIDIVFHCAGVLGGWKKPDTLLWDVNVQGTKNMLEAARESGVKRFIHVSSCGVFGPLNEEEIADEEYPYNPTNIYEKTKIDGEKLVLGYAKKFEVTIVRPEFVYGPGDLHLLPLFKAVYERRFVFFNGGRSTLHPTYIDDAIEGIILASTNPKAVGNNFNITGQKPVSVKEFVGAMSDALEVRSPTLSIPTPIPEVTGIFFDHTIGLFAKPPLSMVQVRYLTENRAFSYEKAKKCLGYKPKTTLETGMRKTVGWYRKKLLI